MRDPKAWQVGLGVRKPVFLKIAYPLGSARPLQKDRSGLASRINDMPLIADLGGKADGDFRLTAGSGNLDIVEGLRPRRGRPMQQ